MNKQQLQKLGYSFKQRENDVRVTLEYCFPTGSDHWDGDRSYDCDDCEVGDYSDMKSAIENVNYIINMEKALDKLHEMKKTVLYSMDTSTRDDAMAWIGIRFLFLQELKHLY